MPLLKEEAYTIDDIYALPDGERAELIDGRMYMMAPPSRKHQRISTRLVSIIDRYSVLLIVILKNIKKNARSMLHHLLFTWMKEVIPM